jgi:hypothetical protein
MVARHPVYIRYRFSKRKSFSLIKTETPSPLLTTGFGQRERKSYFKSTIFFKSVNVASPFVGFASMR